MVWVYVMWFYSYMFYVSLNDYILKIVDVNGVVLMCYIDVWSVKVCCLVKSLVSMCQIMGIRIYIALID